MKAGPLQYRASPDAFEAAPRRHKMAGENALTRQELATELDTGYEGQGQDWERRSHSLISPADVGQANRGRILQALFDLGPTSRAELARNAGVNRATITGIVQPLIEEGVLVEGEPLPAGGLGGKPARPLEFSPHAPRVVGVKLMPGAVRSALVSWTGEVVAKHRRHFSPDLRIAAPAFDAIEACISRTLAAATQPPLGIGVAVGGMVDTDRGSIVAVNLAPILSGLPLGPMLEDRFGLPVCLDHHPRAMLLGDRWFGVGRGVKSFAAIFTGEVLGGALLLDGHLYRGPHGAGGELGHTFVQIEGDVCRCGRRGCWETIATLGWLRREARTARLPDPDTIDSGRLVALVEQGVAGAARVFDRYARNLATGIANLQQTVAPNLYVVHGDVVVGGEPMRSAIERHVRDLVPAHPGGQPQIVLGDPEDHATLRGAAGLVLSQQLQFLL